MQTLGNVNVTSRTTDWRTTNWRKANRIVRNLRQRIFKAAQNGNPRKIRRLQKLMMKCYSNILLAVRRVTQSNRGRNTPGVDKLVIKTPEARGILVDILAQFVPWKPLPTKRVYIPKSNGKKRPLGIATIIDRCIQAIVKNALEPYWESKFEISSYGFRPGRSAHDAMSKIYLIACPHRKKKWVVDADIQGCFDNISHAFLMNTIGNFPARKLIAQWLKSGYIEHGEYFATQSGTPQGNIISPILANVALHGMETALGIKYNNRSEIIGNRALVRYADDFVIFCETKEDAEQVQAAMGQWLSLRGLNLSKEKTKIVHLEEGFDFLGFNIRQYPVTNTKTERKLLIKPSKASLRNIRSKLRQEWLSLKGYNVNAVIKKLNPIIRGIANYYRIGVASEAFSALDDWMFKRECRYVNRTHPKKNRRWRNQRYWGKLNLDKNDRWVFGDINTGNHLLKFSWFKIKRHQLVIGRSSPDDPALKEYWKEREKKQSSHHSKSVQKIAEQQDHSCPVCGQSLYNGEEIHKHHHIPKSKGGKDTYSNWSLVHLYCHQQIHSGV